MNLSFPANSPKCIWAKTGVHKKKNRMVVATAGLLANCHAME